MRQGKVTVVVGGQYGSEAKGHVAAWLAREGGDRLCAVRVAGPNAGHSAYDDNTPRHKWALRQIPVAAVKNRECQLVIGAGSEIDEEVLDHEIKLLDDAGLKVTSRLHIDGSATVVTNTNKLTEARDLTDRLGSTAKGVGAARAARIMREAPVWCNGAEDVGHDYTDTAHMLAAWLRSGRDVLIEGTQGYGLGLHAGYYPFCTSSDCRAVDFLAMAGISPWAPWINEVETWVVLRTYPIRVAGNSGPLWGETTWKELEDRTDGYVRPEYTTVTQKMRRVGTWDQGLASRAVMENGGPATKVALMFFDYWYPELSGMADADELSMEHWAAIWKVESQVGTLVQLIGTGPDSIIDLRGKRT